jgi:hypothetical protein
MALYPWRNGSVHGGQGGWKNSLNGEDAVVDGTTPPEAKQLARHMDVDMTMRYAHIGIDDRANAVANLPSAKLNPKTPAEDDGMITSAPHGRCENCSAESLSESPVGSNATRTEREKP